MLRQPLSIVSYHLEVLAECAALAKAEPGPRPAGESQDERAT